jgi:hypothetical protein
MSNVDQSYRLSRGAFTMKKWRMVAGIILASLYAAFSTFVLFTDTTLKGPLAKLWVTSLATLAIVLLLAGRKLGPQYARGRYILIAVLLIAAWLSTHWIHVGRILSTTLLVVAAAFLVLSKVIKK